MATTEPLTQELSLASTAAADLTRGYVTLRRSYAEAATRATTEAELRRWQDRTSRTRRYWASLDHDDLTEVLDGIAAVHLEQQVADEYIAAQIAAAQPDSRRGVKSL